VTDLDNSHPVRYLTDDEVRYIEQFSGKYATEAVAKQLNISAKTLKALTDKIGIRLPRYAKSKPPVFEGESSFSGSGYSTEIRKAKKDANVQKKRDITHCEQFENPIFKVDFASREVLVDRIWGC
jgi:hypothetical protein